jgi:hypothetical protein
MSKRSIGVRSSCLALAASLLASGCGESGGTPPPTGGAGIPGLRGPAATPKTKAKKGGAARGPAAPAKPAGPEAG